MQKKGRRREDRKGQDDESNMKVEVGGEKDREGDEIKENTVGGKEKIQKGRRCEG